MNDLTLMRALLRMLGSGGAGRGVTDVLQDFRQAGFGDAVDSWISAGQDLPISPEQLRLGLGPERLERLAQSAGVDEDDAAASLARLLPTAIDWLTPDGTLAQPHRLEWLLARLIRTFGG